MLAFGIPVSVKASRAAR